MAVKKKRPAKNKQKTIVKTNSHKPVSAAIRARLKPIKGDKARRFKDTKTGKTYSRRQSEKGTVKKPRANIQSISTKQQKYLTMRDIFIKTQAAKGKKYTKREAMQSEKLKSIIRRLHSKDVKTRQKAWREITNGQKAEWVSYIQRWKQGEL